MSAFESALFQSTLFSSPVSTADEFADQVAEVVASKLNKVAPRQEVHTSTTKSDHKVALNGSYRRQKGMPLFGEMLEDQ